MSVKLFETNPEWFKKAKNKVKKFSNVQIKLTNEEQTLKTISNEPDNHHDIVLVDSDPGDIERILVANAVLPKINTGGYLIIDNYSKFGMKYFKYPKCEIYTFDELNFSGHGSRICKLIK